MLVTEERDGTQRELISQRVDAQAPIGSAFKLYVLAAVADEVAAGKLSWDDTVRVTPETRSLPSGTLQDEPDGTEVSVRQAAEQMISISDNTATDLLIGLVGRERVERAVADLRHAEPEQLRPFLTTREMFQLSAGSGGDGETAAELGELGADWADADESRRRAILERVDEIPLTLTVEQFTGATGGQAVPGWTRGLEWFASPADLASAHRALAERAEKEPLLTEILGKNPGQGLTLDRAAWPEIAFKGGGNIGVTSGSWRAVGEDGTVLTVVMMMSADTPADVQAAARAQQDFFFLAEDIFRLAAQTP